MKISMSKKFKKFLLTFAPMLLIIGLAMGTMFAVSGGPNEYVTKTINQITNNRYKRIDEVRTGGGTKLNLKKLNQYKYKRTSEDKSEVKNTYYMMQKSHLLFTYTEYKDGKISVSIEGEEKYYNVLDNN